MLLGAGAAGGSVGGWIGRRVNPFRFATIAQKVLGTVVVVVHTPCLTSIPALNFEHKSYVA